MSASLRPAGIKLGDGLGDFMRFTTDDAPEADPAAGSLGEDNLNCGRAAQVPGGAAPRPTRRYYGAHSTGIH